MSGSGSPSPASSDSRKKGFKSIKSWVGKASRKALERMGKKEKTLESSVLRDNYEKVLRAQKGLMDMDKLIQKKKKIELMAVKEGKILSNFFSSYGDILRSEKDTPLNLVSCIKNVGEFLEWTEESREKLAELSMTNLSKGIDDLVEGEIKEAKEAMKKYDNSRVALEVAKGETTRADSMAKKGAITVDKLDAASPQRKPPKTNSKRSAEIPPTLSFLPPKRNN